MLMKLQYLQSVINMPLFAVSHLNSFLNSILSPSFCLLPAHSVFIAPCWRIHPSCLPRTVQVCVSHLGRVINSFSFPLKSPVWMLHLCGHPIFFFFFSHLFWLSTLARKIITHSLLAFTIKLFPLPGMLFSYYCQIMNFPSKSYSELRLRMELS